MSALDAFREALEHRGLIPPAEIRGDGRLCRCDVSGKNGHGDGAYIFHADGRAAGGFQNWRDDQGWETWSYKNGHGPLTPAERAELAAKIEADKRAAAIETERRHAEAAKKAAALWQEAKPGPHPYLNRKKVPAFGTRVHDGRLAIPIRNKDRELRSLQFIKSDGSKRYLPDGEIKGCYFAIGKPAGVICIAEGYATAASIHEATGHACVVVCDCGNLGPVTEIIRQKFPNATIVVCADDDHKTTGNPGLTKATAAARATNARLAVPVFPAERADNATDFNDMAASAGLDAVRAIIDRSIAEKESSAWPKPGKIAAELKPVPAFDAEALLPEVLRTWVMDEAERMPCSPDFIAAAALVALGSIIGARCAIKPKANDSWLVVPNLWGGIVGDPSAKKSPAWGAALKPMDSLIAKARTAYEAEQADYEIKKILHGAEKEAIEAKIKDAARSSGKGDPKTIAEGLRTHGKNTPAEPKMRRYKTNDSTVEKLGELLRENPAGLLVLRDELVGLIATWEREGREGERAFFLEGWNGNQSFDTDRIGRGHISIPNLCVSIFGGIQPDKLTVYLEQAAYALANDGMLQRFQVLVYPDPRLWEWRDRAPNREARDAAFTMFETLANLDFVTWGAEATSEFAKFPCFCFDKEAQAIFIEWSTDLHRVRIPAEEDPIIRQHLAKYDKLFPALALVFHLVEGATGGSHGPVTADAAYRAAAWCQYLEGHARRCYGLLKDDGLRGAQTLAAKVQRGALENGFTLRDVRRNQWRNLTTDEPIRAAFDWLVDEDWIAPEFKSTPGPTGGRPTVRYFINPAVLASAKGKAA